MKQTIIRLLAFLMIFSLVGVPTTVNAEVKAVVPTILGNEEDGLPVYPVVANTCNLPFFNIPSTLNTTGFVREFSRFSTSGRIIRTVGFYRNNYEAGSIVTYDYGATLSHGFRGKSKLSYFTPISFSDQFADERSYYEYTFDLDYPNRSSLYQGTAQTESYVYKNRMITTINNSRSCQYFSGGKFYGTLTNDVYYLIEFDVCDAYWLTTSQFECSQFAIPVTHNLKYTFVIEYTS